MKNFVCLVNWFEYFDHNDIIENQKSLTLVFDGFNIEVNRYSNYYTGYEYQQGVNPSNAKKLSIEKNSSDLIKKAASQHTFKGNFDIFHATMKRIRTFKMESVLEEIGFKHLVGQAIGLYGDKLWHFGDALSEKQITQIHQTKLAAQIKALHDEFEIATDEMIESYLFTKVDPVAKEFVIWAKKNKPNALKGNGSPYHNRRLAELMA